MGTFQNVQQGFHYSYYDIKDRTIAKIVFPGALSTIT